MKREGLLGKQATTLEQILVKFPLSYWGITKNMTGYDFKTILDVE